MNKLKRLLKRRRKNSGFTLVEVVISCGLLGILVLGITLFITPVLKSAASNEASVRATLLAETVNNYISRSTRSAYFVQVFTNAKREDALKDGKITQNENLIKMKNFVEKNTDVNGKKVFELKCISFSWENDTRLLENKYMVMNETFVKGTTTINENGIPVFENCFYDGLYPEFIVEQLKETVESTEEGKPPTEKAVPALKITTNVYNNQKMDTPEFIGVGYTEYGTIKNKTINANGNYVFYGVDSVNTPDPDEENPHYSTFIYYVGRRSTEG